MKSNTTRFNKPGFFVDIHFSNVILNIITDDWSGYQPDTFVDLTVVVN